jgi:hypothetical protein
MAIFYPPFRMALDRAAQRHKDEIKNHITSELSSLHKKLDDQHAEHMKALSARRRAPAAKKVAKKAQPRKGPK